MISSVRTDRAIAHERGRGRGVGGMTHAWVGGWVVAVGHRWRRVSSGDDAGLTGSVPLWAMDSHQLAPTSTVELGWEIHGTGFGGWR
jgi:hypothetical protein